MSRQFYRQCTPIGPTLSDQLLLLKRVDHPPTRPGGDMGEKPMAGKGRDPDSAGYVPNAPVGCRRAAVGVIPEDWEVRSFRSTLAEPPSYGINAPAVPFDGSLPTYLRITDIGNDGRFRPTPRVSVRGAQATGYFLRPGDLVFARTGASVGKSYLYDRRDGPLVFAGFLIRTTPDPTRLRPAFVAYYVQSRRYWDWIASNSARSGQPGINSKEYGSLPVPVPPLPEQRAIAAVLSDVDELMGSLEALVAKKRDIKQAAMQQLLTGRKRLAEFEGEWEAMALDEITSRTTGYWGAPRPSSTALHSVRVIRAGDISQRVAFRAVRSAHRFRVALFRSSAELKKASCALGDVVITVSGNGLGKTWLVDRDGMAGSNFVRILRAVPSRAYGPFLAFSLRSAVSLEQLAEHTATSAYPNLLPSFFKTPWLPLPPLPEQQAIATVLSDMDAEIAALERRLDKTRAIKQGMMQQLLTGSIRLPIPDDYREDHPNDA